MVSIFVLYFNKSSNAESFLYRSCSCMYLNRRKPKRHTSSYSSTSEIINYVILNLHCCLYKIEGTDHLFIGSLADHFVHCVHRSLKFFPDGFVHELLSLHGSFALES